MTFELGLEGSLGVSQTEKSGEMRRIGAAQVTGAEVNFFFTAFQGLEFDSCLCMKFPEILLSFGGRFVTSHRSGAISSAKGQQWEPLLESSYGYILPEQICGTSQQRHQGSSSARSPKG